MGERTDRQSNSFLKEIILILIISLYFFFPINLFIIGNEQGFGFQTVFFRYNFTVMGDSIITWIRDLEYIFNGTITGKSIYTGIYWGCGVIISTIGLVMMLTSFYTPEKRFTKYSVYLLFSGLFFFLLSLVNQYGVFLTSLSGATFPIGIPLFILFLLIYQKISD